MQNDLEAYKLYVCRSKYWWVEVRLAASSNFMQEHNHMPDD